MIEQVRFCLKKNNINFKIIINMKSLKITFLAIFSTILLTGLISVNTFSSSKNSNKEVKEVQVDLISMTDKKVSNVPTQG